MDELGASMGLGAIDGFGGMDGLGRGWAGERR